MERFFVALRLRVTYFFDKLIQGAVNRPLSISYPPTHHWEMI